VEELSVDTPTSMPGSCEMPEFVCPSEQLANYRQCYRELAAQLAEVGFIITGTVKPGSHY
jgi:hypothetical protein